MPHQHPVTDMDKHFTINNVTREITNLSSKIVLMQYDHNSECFSFEMPRYVENHDMMLCDRVEINYINTSGNRNKQNCGIYEVKDMQICENDDNLIEFTWLVSDNATLYEGGLSFLIMFACTGEYGETVYRWHTDINSSIAISKGIDNSDLITEVFPDILAQWREEVFGKNFAYEAAKDNGFEGTITEWLESMRGPKGDIGIFVGPIKPEAPYIWFDTSVNGDESKESVLLSSRVDIESQIGGILNASY